jgi:hypothetical protein
MRGAIVSGYRFTVTRQIVTPESAAEGCCDESESWYESGLSLRSAVAEVNETRTAHVDGIESIDGDHCAVTITNGMEFLTGAHESRTLHIPPNISRASGRRIAKLLGVQL